MKHIDPFGTSLMPAICMHWALCIIFLFAFLAWGLAENNGHYAHLISRWDR